VSTQGQNLTKKTGSDAIAEMIEIGCRETQTDALPPGVRLDEPLGLAVGPGLSGQVVHVNAYGGLYETRATVTPSGDYLLMFPNALPGTALDGPNGHYGGKKAKVNDMLAYRSKDKGKTWQSQGPAFDIDYNQHGFIPLIPKGSRRVYAFGTQPIWGLWQQDRGQGENTPIGYRYSDDDGHHWCEPRLIRPQNDPGFLGMSVMRMCETERGTWILGAHETDWSYKPIVTRQYLLRSEDQGGTWQVLPRARHGGWHCPGYGRMDEGRPIHLGGNRVLLLIRTPEGHFWESRSHDDGKTWTEPAATTLVQPDAPPMLFHLADNGTLAAFHHNRHTGTHFAQGDRRELWVSLSRDEGRTWEEPRFVAANALEIDHPNLWYSLNCSYIDMFADQGRCHIFMPHRWRRALHLTISEKDLRNLPTRQDLGLG